MPRRSVGWAAGLFDGEGCISATFQPYAHLQVSVANSHRRALEWFRVVVGSGKVYMIGKPTRKTRTKWQWRIGSRADVERVLSLLLPFLVIKRMEAKATLSFLKRSAKRRRLRMRIDLLIRTTGREWESLVARLHKLKGR